MVTEFEQFLLWEQSTRDTIDFKKIYADMAGDLIAGLVLSEIVYWYLPSKNGNSKLRVEHDGVMWIACRRYEWWDRIRVSPKQADRALALLEEQGLIAKDIFKFGGDPTIHVALIQQRFLPAFQANIEEPKTNPFLPKGEERISPKVNIVIPQRSKTELPFGKIPVTPITASGTSAVSTKDLPPKTAGTEEPSIGLSGFDGTEGVKGNEESDKPAKKSSKKSETLKRIARLFPDSDVDVNAHRENFVTTVMLKLYHDPRMSEEKMASYKDILELAENPLYLAFVSERALPHYIATVTKPFLTDFEVVATKIRFETQEAWPAYQKSREPREIDIPFDELTGGFE